LRGVIVLFLLSGSIAVWADAAKTRSALLEARFESTERRLALIVDDLLRQELSASGIYDLLDRETVKDSLAKHSFPYSSCADIDCAIQAGRLLNCRKVLLVDLHTAGNAYFISLRCYDVKKRMADFADSVEARGQGALLAAVAELVAKVTMTKAGLRDRALDRSRDWDAYWEKHLPQWAVPNDGERYGNHYLEKTLISFAYRQGCETDQGGVRPSGCC